MSELRRTMMYARGNSFLHTFLCLMLAVAIAMPVGAAEKKSSSTKKAEVSDSKPKSSSSSSKSKSSSSSSKSSSSSSKSKSSSSSSKSKTASKSSSSSKSSKTTAKADPITSTTTATLPGLLDAAISRVSGASNWGVMVGLLERNQVLYHRNAEQLFIPASNRKIFTGAFVLDQLGPDFQYHTYLYRTSAVDPSGTLTGNLIIRPQGDPTFSNTLMRSGPPDWIYRDWVEKVKAQNIKLVQGDLIVDCSAWNMGDLTPKGWASTVVDQYAMYASPLTLNDNMLQFRVKPGEPNQPGIIEFVPAAEGYPIINKTVTGGKSSGITVRWNAENRIEVSGTPTEKTASRLYGFPADNPTLFAAAVFRSHLRKAGIEIAGSVRLVMEKNKLPQPTSDNVVALYMSPPIRELVSYMMKKSDNHFAEQLYVSVSAIKAGRGGYSASKALEAGFLQKMGLNASEVNFEDGCGLSRMNAVGAKHIYQLLNAMRSHPHAQLFEESMAVAGRDGTLRGRMQNSHTQDRVFAKTGHINGVSTLSGYIRLPSQDTVAFSLLVNNTRTYVDATQDRICELISMLTI